MAISSISSALSSADPFGYYQSQTSTASTLLGNGATTPTSDAVDLSQAYASALESDPLGAALSLSYVETQTNLLASINSSSSNASSHSDNGFYNALGLFANRSLNTATTLGLLESANNETAES